MFTISGSPVFSCIFIKECSRAINVIFLHALQPIFNSSFTTPGASGSDTINKEGWVPPIVHNNQAVRAIWDILDIEARISLNYMIKLFIPVSSCLLVSHSRANWEISSRWI
jgi:hypothetical protein